MNGRAVPTVADFAAYGLMVPNQKNIIWQPLYDFALYAAAGQQQLTFFQNQIGQGVTSHPGAAGPKTLADTNMTNAGQLPAPQAFLCIGVEIQIWSGLLPGRGPVAENTVGQMANDVHAIARGGNLQFTIGTAPALQEAPLGNFPQQSFVEANAAVADATTAGANLLTQIETAAIRGATYRFEPKPIPASVNFNVTLTWPAVVALPSANATTRIGVRLLGWLSRGVQ